MKKSIYYLLVMVLAGCSKKDNHNDDEHHGETELEPLAYTLYSDKTEIFVEFKPLISGTISKFAAHFTILGESFTALSEGTVTVSLIVNGNGIKQTSTEPAVPGIYRLELKPGVAGTGDLIFDIVTKDFTDRQIINNVTIYPDEKTALESHPTEAGGGGDITYLKEQAWKVEFANMPVKRQPFSDVIKTSGQILSAPGDEMIVIAKADGIVAFAGNNNTLGSQVNAGNSLFNIKGGDISSGNLETNYKLLKANYENAKINYDRAKELIKDQLISQNEFSEAEIRFQNAETQYKTISKNYSSGGQNVSAPISGYIKNILVTEGQFVTAGQPLASISKNKKLILQANVSQKYFNKLSSITSANFKTAESDMVLNTDELGGRVVAYGKSATENRPFIPVTFEINNTGNIIPGSIVEVYLKSFPIPDAMIIPVSALIEEQGNFFVYVQTEGESFQKREIQIGATDGKSVQVISGITEGERVVTKGAYQIKLSSASGILPAHGHEH